MFEAEHTVLFEDHHQVFVLSEIALKHDFYIRLGTEQNVSNCVLT